MSVVVLHAGADLPLSMDAAMAILGVGLVVVAVVAYDAYRQRLT